MAANVGSSNPEAVSGSPQASPMNQALTTTSALGCRKNVWVLHNSKTAEAGGPP